MNTFLLPTLLPTLCGKRITLRAMDDSDSRDIYAIYGDPLVMKYTDEAPFTDPGTVDIMLASVRRLLAGGASLEWAIALRESGHVIGTCGLHHFSARQAEVGCLLRQSAWGQGYMTEALALLMAYAGDILRLDRLLADVAPANERAQRLFTRLGYSSNSSGMLGIALSRSGDAAEQDAFSGLNGSTATSAQSVPPAP